MLFQTKNGLESEKERNFYSKVFAGYYFNELVPGYEQRLKAFSNLLKNSKDLTFSGELDKRFRLSPRSTHVTFDFHGYLLDEKNDRGELADILIADITNSSAVAIEVKFLSNWNFKKDIKAASQRFNSLLSDDGISSFVHVLLITQSKLDGVKGASSRPGSNWAILSRAKLAYPLVILTWEDIVRTCDGSGSEQITAFMNAHLGKSRETFRIETRNLLGIGSK